MGTLSWEELNPITGITKKVLEEISRIRVKLSDFAEWGIPMPP